MTNTTNTPENFSKETIALQVEKILNDSSFLNSDILRKFLSFIIEQTLAGHSSWLKEYTIATNVLNKPVNFNPQENGIVRIHAVRLRRALTQYYANSGANDDIRISIPKGSYVPVFTETANTQTAGLLDDQNFRHKPVIGIAPFHYLSKGQLDDSLAEGLGVLVSKGLMRFEELSVAAYYTMSNALKNGSDLLTVPPSIGAQYIIAGEIQSVKNRKRIFVQLIDNNSHEQIWSQMYEREMAAEKLFEVQDELAERIISDLERSWSLIGSKTRVRPMVMAVA